MDIQTIYLYGLIIGGTLTILYMLFGDIFEAIGAIGEAAPGAILNPTVVLSFISVLCGAGYIFELRGTFDSVTNFLIATLISLLIVSMIHFFILAPLSRAEQSTAQSIMDYIGRDGEVITTIPENGLGEVLLTSALGSTGNIAKSLLGKRIEQGEHVVIIEVEDGVLVVEQMKEIEEE